MSMVRHLWWRRLWRLHRHQCLGPCWQRLTVCTWRPGKPHTPVTDPAPIVQFSWACHVPPSFIHSLPLVEALRLLSSRCTCRLAPRFPMQQGGSASCSSFGGAGSGGRIALHASTYGFVGTMSACGGVGLSTLLAAGPGTVYINDMTARNRSLLVSGGGE